MFRRILLAASALAALAWAAPPAAAQLIDVPDPESIPLTAPPIPLSAAERADADGYVLPPRPGRFCTQQEKSDYLRRLGRLEREGNARRRRIDLESRDVARRMTADPRPRGAALRRLEAEAAGIAARAERVTDYVRRLMGYIADTLPRPIDDCGQPPTPGLDAVLEADGTIATGPTRRFRPSPRASARRPRKTKRWPRSGSGSAPTKDVSSTSTRTSQASRR